MGGAVGKLLSKSCSGGLNAKFRNGIPARFGLMRVGCEYEEKTDAWYVLCSSPAHFPSLPSALC
jgi:hypothetical protein